MFSVVATRPSSPNSRVVRISNRRVLTGSRGLHYPNTSVVHRRHEKNKLIKKKKKWHAHNHARAHTRTCTCSRANWCSCRASTAPCRTAALFVRVGIQCVAREHFSSADEGWCRDSAPPACPKADPPAHNDAHVGHISFQTLYGDLLQ